MEEKPKKYISSWIAWSIIALAVGITGFATWYQWNQIDTITSSMTISIVKKSATTAKTATDANNTEWKTYTNTTYGYSIDYPPTLTYSETEIAKNVDFQTAAEKASQTACQARVEGSECPSGHEIAINVDVTAGTTNADDLTLSIEDIVNARVTKMTMAQNPVSTTLGGQPAFEGMSIGMFDSYNIVKKYNSHIYDLSLVCEATSPSLSNCKGNITTDQQKMIDSFKFTP